MKKLSVILFALLLIIGSSLGVSASTPDDNVNIEISDTVILEPNQEKVVNENSNVIYPIDIEYQTVGDTVYIYKTFKVSADIDPTTLIEENFSKGGYRYKYHEMMQRDEIVNSESKTVSEATNTTTETDDSNSLLSSVPEQIAYNDGENFVGTLDLDVNSIQFEEGEKKSYSYAVYETKTFSNLTHNDPSLIDETITVNGRTLSLQSIEWSAASSIDMGYSAVPTIYCATATYSGSATSSSVGSYNVTYSYSGEVRKELPSTKIYTLVYLGEKVVIPFNYIPILIVCILATIAIVILVLAIKLRSNVKIYKIKDGIPNYFDKTRIDPDRPFVDISMAGDVPLRIVIIKGLHKKLRNDKVYVGGINDNFHITFTDVVAIEIPSESQRQVGEELEKGELINTPSQYEIESDGETIEN